MPTPQQLFSLNWWLCMWCSHENPELEIRCQKCGRKDD